MKLPVLRRISRNFGLQVCSPLTPMSAPSSQCKSVRVERFRLNSGRSKDLVFADGESKLGHNVLLRGGDAAELAKVKYVLRKFLLVYANAKYEAEYLLLSDATPSDPDIVERARDSWYETLSPFVAVKRQAESNLCEIAREEKSSKLEVIAEVDAKSLIGPSMNVDLRAKEEAVLTTLECNQMVNVDKNDMSNLAASHRLNAFARPMRERYQQKSEIEITEVDPDRKPPKKQDDSKSFPVLFASFCPGSKAQPFYCILPWIVNMHFYGASDITLGSFLRLFCFTDSYRYVYSKVDPSLIILGL